MAIFGVLRSPHTVLFGAGQRHALPGLAAEHGSRVFICTDERATSDALLLDIIADLKRAGLSLDIYARTRPELPMECIVEATEQAEAFAPAVVIGLGGGSCMDIAKLVALGLAHPGLLPEYYGELKIPGPICPVIAVPTTAGTGSEATPVAVLGDPERMLKVGISSPYLIPHAAICDPELTLTCPRGLTAISGADALTHAIEAFTALKREPTAELSRQHVFIGKNAFSDAQARMAIQALSQNLQAAVDEGGNIRAREQVMLGAFAAGQAFGVAGTAIAHAMQYPIGALTHTPHGVGVAALLPYAMEFNRPACTPEMAEIGRIFGLSGGDETALSRKAIDRVESLLISIGIPGSVKELGVPEDQLDWISEQACGVSRLVKNNPRPVDLPAMKSIVSAAYAGDRAALKN